MKHQKRLMLISSSVLLLVVALLWWRLGLWDNSTAGGSGAPSASAPTEREIAGNPNEPAVSDFSDKSDAGSYAKPGGEAEPRQTQTSYVKIDQEQWLEDRGSSQELMEIYLSYDLEALLQLASEGDIYALQAGHHKMLKEGHDDIAYQMLTHAAARGSTAALFMAGRALTMSQELVDSGLSEKSDIQSAYGLDVPEEADFAHELQLSAAAHYLVAGMRGHHGRSERELNRLQADKMERRFTDEEWRTISERAEELYGEVRKTRESLGLEPFESLSSHTCRIERSSGV